MKTIFSQIAVLVFLLNVHAEGQNRNDYHISQTETFDVVTWNIEFFGRPDRGPSDIQLQYENVVKVIETLDPDLIALQEIWNNEMFGQLVGDLEEYSGRISNYPSTMDIAFLYKKDRIQFLGSRLIDEDFGVNRTNIANRTPFEFGFRYFKDEMITDTIYAINYHATHGTDVDAFELRLEASNSIKAYFDEYRRDKPLIFLGDYNDDVIPFPPRNYPSPYTPYHNFVEDEFYHVVTKTISDSGRRLIDHITINDHLFDYWLQGSEKVHDPDYIEHFTNTTSDHFPIKVRFDLTEAMATNIDDDSNAKPAGVRILGNYPNPFNPTTMIIYELSSPSNIRIDLFNLLGQNVLTADLGIKSTGRHQYLLDAANLSSGIYKVRLQAGLEIKAHKITIVK